MTAPSASAAPLFSLRGIGQSYGAVTALRGVDLDIAAGEVVAICGDNGAGKSSLIRIMSGAPLGPRTNRLEVEALAH